MAPAVERLVVGVGVVAFDDRGQTPPIEGLDELAENGSCKAHVPHRFLSSTTRK